MFRSISPPVQRGGQVLEHRHKTARRFSRLPGFCMAACYPTISRTLSRKMDSEGSYGRKNVAMSGAVAACVGVFSTGQQARSDGSVGILAGGIGGYEFAKNCLLAKITDIQSLEWQESRLINNYIKNELEDRLRTAILPALNFSTYICLVAQFFKSFFRNSHRGPLDKISHSCCANGLSCPTRHGG